MDGSANDNNDIGKQNGVLATDTFAIDEGNHSSERTSNIVDGSDEAAHSRARVSEHVLKEVAS